MMKGVGLVIVAAALVGVLAARIEAVEDGSVIKVSAEVAASLQNTPERIHRRVLLQDNQIETDVPGTPSRTYCTAYRVKFGDTLHFIALKTGSRVRTLIALNPSLVFRPLFVGEVLAVPPCFTIALGPGGEEEEEEVGVDASDVAEDDVEDLEDIEALAPNAEGDVDLEELVEEILDVDGPALAPSSE